MTDFDIESAVTAGLQAANDHTALDAEWLRKFTRGVLAHHAGPPPLNYELTPLLPPARRSVTFGGITFMADTSLPDDVVVTVDAKGERTAFHFPKDAQVIDEERPLTAEEHALIDKGWADYVEAASKNGPRDDA